MNRFPAIAPALLAAACTAARTQAAAPIARDAAELVQRQVEAYNAQDLEAFLATYADDAVIASASTGQVVMSGKKAMRQGYGEAFRKYPNVRVRVVERKREGDRVVIDHEVMTDGAPARPDEFEAGWVRYEVEGGLIRRVQLP